MAGDRTESKCFRAVVRKKRCPILASLRSAKGAFKFLTVKAHDATLAYLQHYGAVDHDDEALPQSGWRYYSLFGSIKHGVSSAAVMFRISLVGAAKIRIRNTCRNIGLLRNLTVPQARLCKTT